MSANKQIRIIAPDGSISLYLPSDQVPSYAEFKELVGGPIELVRVLRADIEDRNEYTYMIVNETGLIDGLPRNQVATDIYLANVRRAYPNSENPSLQATMDHRKKWEAMGATVIDRNPVGFGADPHICGQVVMFDGWTCDELLEAGL